ncbi:PKD domain-containing protein [Pseudochryseolinea flava]|nr:PKD domain-containing protein [Pseudochryseolinea flava]
MRNSLLLIVLLSVANVLHGQFIEKPAPGKSLRSIYFFDQSLGFMSGERIYKTTDGGLNWRTPKFSTPVDSMYQVTLYDHHFYFFNALKGVATATSIFENTGVVMTTENGGETWKVVFKDTPLNTFPFFAFQDLHFTDALHGFAIGDQGRKIVTSDGGKTWTRSDMPQKKDLKDIFFASADIGFIGGTNIIYKTTDGGATWNALDLGDHTAAFSSIYFTSVQVGYATGDNYIYKTVDGGRTWSRSYFQFGYLDKVYFVDTQNGYAVGNGNTMRTKDGGENWEALEQTFPVSLYDVYFRNVNTGYVVGFQNEKSYYGVTTTGTGSTIPRAGFDIVRPADKCVSSVHKFINHGNATYAHTWFVDDIQKASTYDFETSLSEGHHTITLITKNLQGIEAIEEKQVYVDVPNKNRYRLELSYVEASCVSATSFDIEIKNMALYEGTDFQLWANGKKLTTTVSGKKISVVGGPLPEMTAITIKPFNPAVCYMPEHDTTIQVKIFPANLSLNYDIDNLVVCRGDKFNVTFHNTDPNIYYNWYNESPGWQGNGAKGNGGDLIIEGLQHEHLHDNKFYVRAYMWAPLCDVKTAPVLIHGSNVKADFALSADYIYREESIAITNESVEATNYVWSFDAGSIPKTSTSASPGAISYTTLGLKQFSLEVNDGHGCVSKKDTIVFVSDKMKSFSPTICEVNSSSFGKEFLLVDSDADEDGNVYRTGFYRTPEFNSKKTDLFFTKHDAAGNLQWEIKDLIPSLFQWPYDFQGVLPRGVETDNMGNIYLAIDFHVPYIVVAGQKIGIDPQARSEFYDTQAAILKFSPKGDLMTYTLFAYPGNDNYNQVRHVYISDVVVDDRGRLFSNLYLSGGRKLLQVRQGNGKWASMKDVPGNYEHSGSLVEFDLNLKMKRFVDHGEIGSGYVIPNDVFIRNTYSLQELWFAGPKLHVRGDGKVILAGCFNAGNGYDFGNIIVQAQQIEDDALDGLGKTTFQVMAALLGENGWESAISFGAVTNHFKLPNIDAVTAEEGTNSFYLAGAWDFDNYYYTARMPKRTAAIINGKRGGFHEITGFIAKATFGSSVEWSSFNRNVKIKSIVPDVSTGKLVVVGDVTKFGIFNVGNDAVGMRAAESSQTFVGEYTQTGSINQVSLQGDLDFRANALVRNSCGQLAYAAASHNLYEFRKISFTGNCEMVPPTIDPGNAGPDDPFGVCKGDSIQMGIMGASYFKWIPETGVANPSSGWTKVSPSVTTTYTVYGYIDDNCFSKKPIKIIVEGADPIVSYETDQSTVILQVEEQVNTFYEWDFGNGEIQYGAEARYTYPRSGIYDVCVKASGACGEVQKCVTVDVVCDKPSIGTYGYNVGLNLKAEFSATQANNVENLRWHWDFGDGSTSSQQNPTHVYLTPGKYKVQVSTQGVCNADTVEFEATISCLQAAATIDEYIQNLVVTFSSQMQNVTDKLWDFGDGSTSTENNPIHTFELPGVYNVCLKVSNGCSEKIICKVVTVTCAPPTAEFSADISDLKAEFYGTHNLNSSWDFGDGNLTVALNPVHSYQQQGTYTVCQTVSNKCGVEKFCDEVVIDCINPTADFLYEVDVNEVSVINTSQNASTWEWSFSDGTKSTNNNIVHHEFTNGGMQSACLITRNECLETATQCYQFEILITDLEKDQSESFDVFPVPVDNILTIELRNLEEVVSVELIDITGVTKHTMINRTISPRLEIDVAKLSAGLYYVKVKFKDRYEGRFVMKR